MQTSQTESYLRAPQFREAMENFQFGEWQKGLIQLNELMERYPFDLDLRAVNQEMQMRAKIDTEEVKENQSVMLHKVAKWGIRGFIVLVALAIILLGFQFYSGMIREQYLAVRQKVNDEAKVLERSAKFRNGQSLFQAGYYSEALALFKEIEIDDPDYEQLQFYIQESESLAALDAEYNAALELIRQEDYQAAYDKYQAIAAQRSNFRDVLIRINDLEKNFLIVNSLEEANQAFQNQDWVKAIEGYENIRTLDPGYYSQDVEEFLYRSYIFAAEEALADENQTLESLKVAEDYFSRALTLRPQNPEIRARRAMAMDAYEIRLANSYLENAENILVSQPDSLNALKIAETYFNEAIKVRPNDEDILKKRELAKMYLQAIDNYGLGFWDNVIEIMEVVYQEDPDYASGTARQTLYEAYVARARNNLVIGDYNDALTDSQNAALIAQESPDSLLRLYESQLLVAEAQGLLGNFQDAVLIYQAAVELSDIGNRALLEKPSLADAINYAGSLSAGGDFRSSFVAYRDALRQSGEIYVTVTHKVTEGEYLTQLARQYNTTVQAILDANDLTNRNKIELGTELIIPTLP